MFPRPDYSIFAVLVVVFFTARLAFHSGSFFKTTQVLCETTVNDPVMMHGGAAA
jgi:hypothetical protein